MPDPFALDRALRRRVEEFASLSVGNGRCFTFAGLGPRSFDAAHRVVGHRIDLAEMIKERGQGRELAPDRRRAAAGFLQVLTPSEQMGAGDRPELPGVLHPKKRHEPGHIVAIRPAGVGVGDVGKPLQLRRHVVELVKARVGEFVPATRHHDQIAVFGVHLPCSKGDNGFYQP